MSPRFFVVFFAFIVFCVPAFAEATYNVETKLGDWTDTNRGNRVVPWKIYYPRELTEPRPIVIFSHGLGGNREGAEYLLHFLAAHGYIAVAVQHPGSDTPAVLGGRRPDNIQPIEMRQRLRGATTPAVAIDRFDDIPFAIDQLTLLNAGDLDLRNRLDLSRIGMSGHSFGAVTTQALAGQNFANGTYSFADDRIRAAIAYSPSNVKNADPVEAFAGIRIPTFHMTGTRDMNPLDESDPPESRLIPYRSIRNADKFLLVFKNGDHMIFSGRDFNGRLRPMDEGFHVFIQKASLAFWDSYLLQKAEAKSWLTGGAFKQELGTVGSFEFELH